MSERLRVLQEVSNVAHNALEPRQRSRLEELLMRLNRLISRLNDATRNQAEAAGEALLVVLGPEFDRVQGYFTSAQYEKIPEWISDLEFQFPDLLEFVSHRVPPADESSMLALDASQTLANAIEQWTRDSNLQSVVDQARAALDQVNEQASEAHRAVEEAQASAQLAADAAGEAGEAALGDYFKGYATDELKSANGFRVATIAMLLVSLALAILYAMGPLTIERSITHAVQVFAAAGLATFLATQASGHRRIGNWAKALEVQLKSFPAFVEPVRNSAAAESLYELLGQRVLGTPPKSGKHVSGIDAKQIEQLAAILSASRP